MRKRLVDTKAKVMQGMDLRWTRKGGSSGGGTPTTTRPPTPAPTTDLGPLTPGADPGTGWIDVGVAGVAQLATVDEDNTSITNQDALQVTNGVSSTDLNDSSTIVQEVRNWWKAHRGTVLASAQFVLESVEKGLDGMPVPGPKAAMGAFAGVVKAVRILDENHASVNEITEKVEELTSALAQFMVPTLPDLKTTSVSEDMRIRVQEFNQRLTKVKTSASAHPTTGKNILVRLADAERVSQELKDVWTEIQIEYLHLIAVTGLSTEQKINEVQRHLLLDRLKPALSALYDDVKAAPSCLETTRVDVLAHIEEWMSDLTGKSVYWLTGAAGTGKTTIAQSVAMMADAKDCRRLLGSFFFSRTGAADRRSAAAVIPTLAYQLALKNGTFCSHLCDAIDFEPNIFRKKVEVQAKALLCDTCASISSRFPYPLVIVIDALNECEREQGCEGGELIPVLIGALQNLPFRVKVFITSRPESSIENMFNQADLRDQANALSLHRNIEDHIVRGDIGCYLRHGLDRIAARHFRVTVPPPFPREEQFVALQDRADTLFIYARMALEYISNSNANPRHQIELLLNADSRKASRGFGMLDGLYKHVLSEALEHSGREVQEIRDVLASLVLLRENMPITALAVLNGIEEEDCQTIVRSLASVLLFDRGFTEPIRPIHLSFSDFLLDRNRSTDTYAVDVSTHHLRIVERCLQTMNEGLREDICAIGDPSLFNTEVTGLEQRLAKVAPPHLRYACRFWHVHFELAGIVSDAVASNLEEFCKKHLLHWIELLSLLKELPVVLPSVPSFLAYLHGFEGLQDIYALLSDVVRLAASYQVPVTVSALHVYHSAVVTMPSCRLQELTSKENFLPVLISERPTSWQRILEGHFGWVLSVGFSCDGKYIVSGSLDYTVRLWDAATGIQLRIMDDHQDRVTLVTFSGNGKNLKVISGSWDRTVRVWDVTTGLHLRTMNHERAVLSVAASHDSQLIVSGTDDHTIRVWDTLTGTLRFVLNGHSDKVYSIAFSCDSKLVVSGSKDRTLRVWDVATGMQRLVISGHEDPATFVAFSKDDRFIVSGARYNTIRGWNADTGTPVFTIDDQKDGLLSIAILRNENLIASRSYDGTIRLWDATTGHFQRLIEAGHTQRITSVAISDDSKFLAVGYENGPLCVSEMSVPTDVKQRNQTGHMHRITAIAFSGDGMFVVSWSADCTAKVWSTKTGVELSTMSGHTSLVPSAALSGDGKLVVSGSWDCTVRLWEAETGTELRVLTGHEDPVFSVALSGDEKLVASGSEDCTVRVWDVVAGTHLYTMFDHKGSVSSVAFSDDSSFVVSGSRDETIRIWDTATGIHLFTITDHTSWRNTVAFLQDGRSIISRARSGDGTIRVWEASTVVVHDAPSTSLPHYVEAPDSPRCDHFKVGRDGWISRLSARNSWQRLCWLPTERRGEEFAYNGQTICIGTANGAVTILDFSPVRVI